MCRTPEKELVDSMGQSSNDINLMFITLKLGPISKESKYLSLRKLLFINQVLKNGQCSTRSDSAMNKSNFHELMGKVNNGCHSELCVRNPIQATGTIKKRRFLTSFEMTKLASYYVRFC